MDERMTPAPDAPPAEPVAARRRRAGSPRSVGGWYRRHVWSATAVLIILVLTAGFVALQVVVRERVGDGVTVAGLELQGQSASGARAALARDFVPRVAAVQLQTESGEPLALTLAQLGMSVDTTATADAALASGRHRLPLGLDVWLPGGGGDVAPVIRVDAAGYQRGLEAVRAVVDVPARDARLDISAGGDGVTVVPSKDGTTTDAVALKRAIEQSIVAGTAYAGPVPMKAVPSQVSTADAEARAGVAAMYLARPLTLRYRERTVVLSPREMAAMLSVNKGSDADIYPLTFRNARAAARLHELFAWAETPPVNALIKVYPEGGITVTPSQTGEVLDMKVLLEDLDDAALGGGLRSVFVALKPAMPALTSDDVETMGLAALGAQFVTYFDQRNISRAGNIALAAKL
ncbi:MAG: peptidoglycan binding domain-containing protein, partial [Actinobacteria bacterium]|nr:peptidoglycan binding domain-containing protein [Actinomycetota bacterium]